MFPRTLLALFAAFSGASAIAAIDLSGWKLTLPVDADGNGVADEILRPESMASSPWFEQTAEGLVFRTPAGGARTSARTAFARTELREMNAQRQAAAWSCETGERSMFIQQRLLATPRAKPEAALGQIHDARNDNAMLKYTGPASADGQTDTGRIELLWNNASGRRMLDAAYRLGNVMQLRIAVAGGVLRVDYRNLTTGIVQHEEVRLEPAVGACFFKAGLYVQACSLVDLSGQTNLQCVAKNWRASRHDTPDAQAVLLLEHLELDPPEVLPVP